MFHTPIRRTQYELTRLNNLCHSPNVRDNEERDDHLYILHAQEAIVKDEGFVSYSIRCTLLIFIFLCEGRPWS